MDEIEVGQYFICPISLQIMKDPVTTITGISYERESIEKWLKSTARNMTCPVTKQPLPRDSALTSNHTLRRLIQAWCMQNAIDRIPPPKDVLDKDQIMKDPVTTITGISYERESIEKWLKTTARNMTCPVTKQPLPRDSALTSNHTLRRLIQAWCMQNAIDRIPPPKDVLDKDQVRKLVRDLDSCLMCTSSLKKMEALVMENERNRKSFEEAYVVRALVLLIVKCYKDCKTIGLEEALRILSFVWSPSNENKAIVDQNQDLIRALMWVLRWESNDSHVAVKTNAMVSLKMILEVGSTGVLEGLSSLDLFKEMVNLLKENISQQATKSALNVLIQSCPLGRNRMKIIEANAVFELIELELSKPEKSTTELIFNLLAQLCTCADGRFKFLSHAGAIAMVTKRILRVSQATDDRAVHILSSIAKCSATYEVVIEMLSVGAVTKLCMVSQADCEKYLKDKAKEILRLHSNVWNNSPCIQVYLLTRYQR